MITSKFPSGVIGDGWLANMETTIVRERTEPKEISSLGRLTVANTATDAKCFGVHRYVAAVQKVRGISPHRRPMELSAFESSQTAEPRMRFREKRGKSELKKGDDLMKTTMKSKRRSAALLSNTLRRSRCNVSGRMCRHAVRVLAPVIIRLDITRDTRTTITHTRIPITGRPTILQSCAGRPEYNGASVTALSHQDRLRHW